MQENHKTYPVSSKDVKKETTVKGIDELCNKKIKDFIPHAVNPNNGAAFETYNDPLSSKGN